MKGDVSILPIDEQIKRKKRGLKFIYFFAPIYSVFVIVFCLYLIICTPSWGTGVIFLCQFLFQIWCGIQQTKVIKQEIKKLQEQKAEQEKKVDCGDEIP